MPILSKLRERDVQWFIDNIVVSKVVVRGRELPFLVFAGLRGTMPYAPARVLRQLGCKQVIPQTGNMRKFVTDNQDGQAAFDKMIIREWKTRSMAEERVPDRYHTECSDIYKRWLKESLAGIIKPGSNVPNSVKDVEAENQVLRRQHLEDTKVIEQLMQELNKVRQRMVELDDHMEHQIQTLGGVGHDERAQSTRDYLQDNRYFIWHEVEIAKVGAEAETV